MSRYLLLPFLLFSALALTQTAAADEAQARELLNAQGCKGCHRLGGEGGTVGPDLTGVGARLSREQLRQQLLDPRSRNSDGSMPAFNHLPANDIETLVDFLAELR
ncbi:hypothetical protein JCM30471_31670 [Desulfuromonas carbonis]|nr:lipoprotein cytochrome c, 1 heme-binding site [Desulfuromonas sp. DDH964]